MIIVNYGLRVFDVDGLGKSRKKYLYMYQSNMQKSYDAKKK